MMVGRDWTERLVVGAWTTTAVVLCAAGQGQLGALCAGMAATIVWQAAHADDRERLSRLRQARVLLDDVVRRANERSAATVKNRARSNVGIGSKVEHVRY